MRKAFLRRGVSKRGVQADWRSQQSRTPLLQRVEFLDTLGAAYMRPGNLAIERWFHGPDISGPYELQEGLR